MSDDRAEKVVIVEYDPHWPSLFEELSVPILGALRGLALAVEHVGSTAVPRLAAKPIIDMDVVIPTPADLPTAVERLAAIGYAHQGDLGIRGREAFLAPRASPKHHLYACPVDGDELRRHLLFRDYLRAHPDAAGIYAALKQEAARRFAGDRDGYTSAKSRFIEEFLRTAQIGRASPL